MKTRPLKATLFCDGASRGNPGPGSYGYVIYDGSDEIARGCNVLGIVTNNIAEYTGLLMALKHALQLGIEDITVKSDSQLMIRQLAGDYKVKAEGLIPLFKEAKKLLAQFKTSQYVHVPREENKLADKLANHALDSQ